MADIIPAVILFVISLALFTVSVLHFMEKGFLINNAYIYASEEERLKMNKKPYYRQSAVVFALLGIIFLLNAFDVLCNTKWLFYIILIMVIITLLYSVISSLKLK